jgi:hypothetical protein
MSRTRIKIVWVLLLVVLAGCGGGATSYVRDDVDYSHIRRVAIYPFQNRSQDPQAGPRVQSVFVTELLTRNALQTLDPGESLAAMRELKLDPGAELSAAQILALGQRLSVDAIFFGAVDEYGYERESGDRVSSLTLTLRLAETETGTIIWQSQDHRRGTSVWRKIFGGGTTSLHDISRAAVDDCLRSLI